MSFAQSNRERIRKIILSLPPKNPYPNPFTQQFDDSAFTQRPRTTLNVGPKTVMVNQKRLELIQEDKRNRVKEKIKENIRFRVSRLSLMEVEDKGAIMSQLQDKNKCSSTSFITHKNAQNSSDSNFKRLSSFRLSKYKSTIERCMSNIFKVGPCELSNKKVILNKKLWNSQNLRKNNTRNSVIDEKQKKLIASSRYQTRTNNPENQLQKIQPWTNDQDYELKDPVYKRRRLQIN